VEANAEGARPFANAPDPEAFAARTLAESGDFHEQFEAAATSARRTREAGYTIGVDSTLQSLTFADLELMAGRPRLRQELAIELPEAEGNHLPEAFLQALWQNIHDYDQEAHLDKEAMRVSATFLDAVVDGVRDAHAALVSEARSRPPADTP
jgi:hypothetical protein